MAEINNQAEASTRDLAFEDRLRLWVEKNRQTVLLGCVAALVIAVAFIFWYWRRSTAEDAASRAMDAAKTVPEWEQVASNYPGTAAAPLALLLAGDDLFAHGRYKEAQAGYERFLQQYPRHELAGSAQFGLAASLESQAKTHDDFAKAEAGYAALRANYPNNFHNGEAELAMARCAVSQDDPERARHILENVMASMPNSQTAREAAAQLAVLNRTAKPVASTPSEPNMSSLMLPSASQSATSSPAPAPPPSPSK